MRCGKCLVDMRLTHTRVKKYYTEETYRCPKCSIEITRDEDNNPRRYTRDMDPETRSEWLRGEFCMTKREWNKKCGC